MIEKICEDIFLRQNYNTIATLPKRVILVMEKKMLNPCKINDSLITTISQFFRRRKKITVACVIKYQVVVYNVILQSQTLTKVI